MQPGKTVLIATSLLVVFTPQGNRGLVAQATVTSLEPRPQRALAPMWRVDHADIEEGFTGTFARLRLRNASAEATDDARFYAEYFDALDRFCFSLVFAQEQNVEKRTGSFAPGEVRTLYAGAYYLSPAARSVYVKVYLISARRVGSTNQSLAGVAVVRSPVRVEGSPSGRHVWERAWLASELERASGPFLDLVLARISVGSEGDLRAAEIIDAASDAIRAWFSEFIRNQKFRPEETNGTRQPGLALILVRAGVSVRCTREKPFPARESPFVERYVKQSNAPEFPPLIELILKPSSLDYWTHPQPWPEYFEYVGIGAGWADVASPKDAQEQDARRSPAGPPLRRIDPPEESYGCP